ncbi:tubulin-tyrosine ligase family, partial [Thraustotheca clavata]
MKIPSVNEASPLVAKPLTTEVVALLNLAVPLILSAAFDHVASVVPVMMLGHLNTDLSKAYIAAIAMGTTFLVLTAWTMIWGNGAAMDTICSQSPILVNCGVLDVLLSVCQKRQEILPDEVLDNVDAFSIDPVVTDLQWEVLQRCSIDKVGAIRPSFQFIKPVVVAESNTDMTPSEQREDARLLKQQNKYLESAFGKEKERLNGLLGQMEELSTEKIEITMSLLNSLEALCPQFHLNGADCKNVWIVKPAGMSRGRGIRVFNQLDELLAYADVENHKECQWIVQKYIENPLLVCNRKFDIRQWVFVTSWNPLTVWFYMDCYLRFSSEEYQVDDLVSYNPEESDQYVHLTNNSIQKLGENFYKAYSTEDGSMT